jgi:hypothetical protein
MKVTKTERVYRGVMQLLEGMNMHCRNTLYCFDCIYHTGDKNSLTCSKEILYELEGEYYNKLKKLKPYDSVI